MNGLLINKENIMLAYTYIEHEKFALLEKWRPMLKDSRDAIVRVTLSSLCTSDLHIQDWRGGRMRLCRSASSD